ncbi:hypothetical protein Csa_007513 [Cucumis sativus]|uniref:Myb/SANT-like domain-containing protein n=1 Tax=Cucumis sativus TaxID=3659 RepID=A0A0A0LXJ7_CUCSA|nr:hypothetical protein Csa_007513 [Cucumis sativus]
MKDLINIIEKINPEAKSFCGRVFENYDQFCISFRYYNMEVLDFPVVVNDGKTGCEGNSLGWTSEMDHCLRRVLKQHVIPGNKGMLDNKLNPVVYDAAILNLREMFALELTKDQVEDRFKSWKREYGLLRDLLDQGDFEWDDQQKMLVAKDSVWDVSIEIIENYDELCVIAGCDIPSGSSLNAAADNLDLSVDEAINARDVCHNQSNSKIVLLGSLARGVEMGQTSPLIPRSLDNLTSLPNHI